MLVRGPCSTSASLLCSYDISSQAPCAETCAVIRNPALPDADGDGAANACDQCPATVGVGSAIGCSQAQVDPDVDTVCVGALLDPAFCIAAHDNCRSVRNTNQLDADNDNVGNVRRCVFGLYCDAMCVAT